MWPTLKALEALGGSGRVRDIYDTVVHLEGLAEEQQSTRNRRYLEFRLRWARAALRAVGAVDNSSRNLWSITDKGRHLTEDDLASALARVRSENPDLTAYPSFRRHSVALVAASVVLVLCAILGPIVFVVGPDAFGHGVVAGSLLLVIESALVLSLVVLFAWAVSVGARPWRASRGVGVTQQIFVTVIVLAASMMLLAIMVGATLYAFGAHLG
jgi:Mrr N-terminal domain